MCMSVKTPKPPEAPASPPPPTAVAETVKPQDKGDKTSSSQGVSALTKRRPTVGGLGLSKATTNY